MYATDTKDVTTSTTYGDNTNGATLVKSDNGDALTIKAHGDLTKISPAYKFVSNLSGNLIFLKGDNDNYTTVNANDAYISSNTYATRSAVYTEIENFADTYTEKKTHYYFTETGAGKYYTRQQTSWDENPTYNYTNVKQGEEVTKTEWVDNAYKPGYFTRSGEEGNYTYTRVNALTDITNSKEDATSEEKTHLKSCNDDTFYSTDGNNYKQAQDDDEYDESATYYTRTWNYTNITFDELIAKACLINESEFIKALWVNAAVATVKFVNDGQEGSTLTIDNDIVKAILFKHQTTSGEYPKYSPNTTTTTLDLGETTCKDFSTETFKNDMGTYGNTTLATLTLPQATDKTVPAQIVENIKTNLKTVNIPEGYTKVGNNAFKELGNTITQYNLANSITEIGDSAFLQSYATTWTLPTSLTTIGTDAFCASQTYSVTFPSTLKSIGKGAFANCNGLYHIQLNDGLEFIGNSAFYRASEEKRQAVLNIPSTVKYIGPGAFKFRYYTDIYYYGDKAPISPMGSVYSNSSEENMSAFSRKMLVGEGGFSKQSVEGTTMGDCSKGYANRENYTNGGNFAILHFRANLTEDNAKTFTDVTRKYKTYTGNGSFPAEGSDASKYLVGKEDEQTFSHDGISTTTMGGFVTWGYKDTSLGEQFIWPSQSQFCRSFAVNSNGYEWNGYEQYKPELSKEEIKMIQEDVTSLAKASDDDIRLKAYMGTRQFVLVNRDIKDSDKQDEYDSDITTGQRWWTLCVPCDVTKAEVDQVFGEGTHLCLFSKVIRQVDESEGNEIHLFFQNDTYKNKYTRAGDGTWTKDESSAVDDNTVVLYAHTPYMIYPTKDKPEGSASFILKNFTRKDGDVLPTVVAAIAKEGDTASDDATQYIFTGNYRGQIAGDNGAALAVRIPQYTYAFGRKKTTTDNGTQLSKFWFYTGTNGEWKANKCLVERYDDNGKDEYNTFFNHDGNNGAKQFSIFGDDDDVTGIEKVVYHLGDNTTDARIYGLGGQLVGTNGTDGLAKGVYVKGGKKFIVK